MGAIYSLGAICAVPFVAFVTDTWGRRFAILFGSIIMIIGAALQTAAQNCTSLLCIPRYLTDASHSRHVRHLPIHHGNWYRVRYCRCLVFDWRWVEACRMHQALD